MVVSMLLIPGDFELLDPSDTITKEIGNYCNDIYFFVSYYLYYFLGIIIMISLAPQFKWLEKSS